MPSTGKTFFTVWILNPIFSIACIIDSGETRSGSKSTRAEAAPKLTRALDTPSSSPTFFSIRAAQLAQLIPSTGRTIWRAWMVLVSDIIHNPRN